VSRKLPVNTDEMRDYLRKLDAALDRIDELEDLAGIGKDCHFYESLGLIPMAAKVLGHLMKREIVSRQTLHALLYGEGAENSDNAIDVYISMVRNALKPFGVIVVTHWKTGWTISKDDKAKVEAVLPRAGDRPRPRRERKHEF